MAKKKRTLIERLNEAADRWEPLAIGKLCREAAEKFEEDSIPSIGELLGE